MDKILTLEDFTREGGSPTLALVRRNWPFWLEPPRQPEGVAAELLAYAEVNHGRWIVNCPMPDPEHDDGKCRGAQMASRSEHRFFCVDCLHRYEPAARGRWVRVQWPAEVAQIEQALAPRPVKRQNWTPAETAMVLRAENAAFLTDEWVDRVFDG